MSKELLIPYRKGLKWGYCDVHKNIIIAPQYSVCRPFHEGLAVVARLMGHRCIRFGYIDEIGHEVIPLIYEWAADFCEGRALVVSLVAEKSA